MEAKINIVEILKNKPQGTKLYFILSDGECFLNEAFEDSIYIDIDNGKRFWRLSAYGSTHSFPNGCVLLFPSKEMRDWSKFSWKKGDVLVSNDSDSHIIFKGFSKNDYTTFEGKHWISVSKKRHVSCLEMQNVQDYHIEDNKDSAQTYISTIEGRLGGKLNRETLEIEKDQAEFKDGDIAFADFGKTQDVFIVSGKTNLSEGYYSFIALNLNSTKALSIGCKTSFFKENLNTLRLATEEEKQQLFDALAEEGKAWDAEKKQIVDLKPKVEFKSFDRVLCRDGVGKEWHIDLFESMVTHNSKYYYKCMANIWKFCIPYDGNESLLGTTKDVED